jgi:cardiolipin synthase
MIIPTLGKKVSERLTAARTPGAEGSSQDTESASSGGQSREHGHHTGAAQRARPSLSAAAVLLRVAALVVVLALALIAFLSATRGSVVRRVRDIGSSDQPVSPREPEFALGVAMLTGVVLLPNNGVEIAANGDETFPRLWADLRSAQRSIIIQMYYGLPGRIADTLRSILTERASAGVRVLALYDAFGTGTISDTELAALRAAGIQVYPFRPLRLSSLNVVQNRAHVRRIVVDGRIGWTGGFGIDDKWLGDGHSNGGWRDTNVRFEGPAVRQLEAAFAAAWAEATGVLLTGRLTVPMQPSGTITAGLLYASPTLGSTAAERFLALSIAGASKSLYITNAYFAPDANFVDLLVAAAKRGVDVRLLLAGPRTDVRLARHAARARYNRLLAAGVRVFEWQPTSLHAKTFVVDERWSSVGTMNFDNRSLVLNDEVTLMVLDDGFGQRMATMFRNDLERAVEITPDAFARRPWTERVLEEGANLIARVL